jgi:hypothetical protein
MEDAMQKVFVAQPHAETLYLVVSPSVWFARFVAKSEKVTNKAMSGRRNAIGLGHVFSSVTISVLLAMGNPLVGQELGPVVSAAGASVSVPKRIRFKVSFPASLKDSPVDGRLLLAISKDDKVEPRFSINRDETISQELLGVQVDGLKPNVEALVDDSALGYPVKSIEQLPAGDYYVQAVLNLYETFKRADGHILKLPPDKGEGQQWNLKPGNLYSKPKKIHIDSSSGEVIPISLTERIAMVEPPKDTKYVKHIRIESKLLSEFWGRPMYLGATVVLPAGFDEHPNARYPLLVYQDHFQSDFKFYANPPVEGLGSDKYKFQEDWMKGGMPHVILLEIQHANPYFDDSYAVNSENIGPYGDAIIRELIPEVERQFHGIGKGWARGQFGGSTGGWEALAQQIFYPEDYNWTYSFCPDPIDFHACVLTDIYNDKNAFWLEGPFGKVLRPFQRDTLGQVKSTVELNSRREEVIGTKGRSGEQIAAWQAVYSPVGADGYPKPIWDSSTGVIDNNVANYWRDHYDLNYIMQRDWKTLGPKLVGKIHVLVGDMDDYYLNNAVHLFQDFHDGKANPYRVAEFTFGYRQPHSFVCPKGVSIHTFLQDLAKLFVARVEETAPKGTEFSWKY